MELIKLLNSGLINISKLAEGVYPDKKFSAILLNHKLKNARGQRLNGDDIEKIKKYLQKHLDILNI